MKFCGKWLAGILCMMLIVPILPLLGVERTVSAEETTSLWVDPDALQEQAVESVIAETEHKEDKLWRDEIKVYDHKTEEVLTLPMLDYIKGVVCAEMPASFEEEAIKAQAVIAYTYTLRICAGEEQSPTESLKGAMISTDSSKHQAYMSEEEIKELYGKSYDTYWEKISRCVEEVFSQYLSYENQPIIAAFHAISSGKTETAESVWGTKVPYLVATESEGDLFSPQYTKQQSLRPEEVGHILQERFPKLKLNKEYKSWFSDPVRTESDYVTEITVLGEKVSGQEIREMFLLQSSCFDVTYEDGAFLFTTKGYGHGVGLSQYGADYLARQGQSYEEILMHYYPNTTLVK